MARARAGRRGGSVVVLAVSASVQMSVTMFEAGCITKRPVKVSPYGLRDILRDSFDAS